MTICYFGDYNTDIARNRVIIKGFEENGVEVIECNSRSAGFKKYIDLIKIHKNISNKYDYLVVGYSMSRSLVLLASLLSKKPIIWNPLYSLYDSWVFDRKLTKPISIKAFYYWFLDWINCKLSDTILLDTNEHIKYFKKTFKIKEDKFIRVLVGSNDNIFYPL